MLYQKSKILSKLSNVCIVSSERYLHNITVYNISIIISTYNYFIYFFNNFTKIS